MRLGKIAIGFVAVAVIARVVAFAAHAAGNAAVTTAARWVMLAAIPAAVIMSMAGLCFDKNTRLASIAAGAALVLWLIHLAMFFWPAVSVRLR